MRITKVVTTVAVAALAVAVAPASVHAAADLRIPLDTVIVSGVVEGEQVELALVASDALAGRSCTVRAVHEASGDVHPANELVVTSGVASANLLDVERAPGATTDATAALTLGDVIRVELVMGPDESFGGDVDVELDCAGVTSDGAAQARAVRPVTGPSSTTVQPAPGTPDAAASDGPAPDSDASELSALPVTGPSSTTVQLALATMLLLSGYGLTVLARRPERG